MSVRLCSESHWEVTRDNDLQKLIKKRMGYNGPPLLPYEKIIPNTKNFLLRKKIKQNTEKILLRKKIKQNTKKNFTP